MQSAMTASLQVTRAKLHRRAMMICSGLTPIRIRRLLILAIYLTMNLGLPSGFGIRTIAASTASGCRCSAESRAAGRCCCNRPLKTGKPGCCAARLELETKSCCTKKFAPPKVIEEESAAWTGDCPCDTNNLPPMLLCPQPRIIAGTSSLDVLIRCTDRLTNVACVPCGVRSRPSVPPPEFAAV